ncbi:hypothetical protein HID58_034691 [Brassica napus]|uniref:Uncharacterized protein n=1 Tax=Brassica napus TaxID=3708 RepID=A0ABQ8C2T5_BRANA|nr:hypothetical protein HID58_034691 [Brassica napus]
MELLETLRSGIEGVNGEEDQVEVQTNIISDSGTRISCKEKINTLNSDKLQVPLTVTPDSSLPTSCAFGEASTEVGHTISKATSSVLAGLALPQPQLQGAWTKPLLITGATESSTLFSDSPAAENSEWPALSTRDIGRKKNQSSVDRTKAVQQTKRVDSSSTQRVKLPTDKTRFPWAARMNPQTRNLHRVTVPEYMEDGTPKVTIPDHVLLHVAHVFASADASPPEMNIQKVIEVSSETSQEAAVAKRDATLSDIPIPSQIKEAMSMATVQASNSQQYISHAPVSDKPATPKEDTSCICDEVIDKINSTDVDDLVSLATVSVLENLYESPTVICVNETIESSPTESAPTKQHIESSITQTSTEVSKESIRMQEIDLGSNQFASLTSLEGEEEYQLDLDESSGPIDILTPLGKRLLRERPVKPSAKGMEWQLQSSSRGRGNRGRGNRGKLR